MTISPALKWSLLAIVLIAARGPAYAQGPPAPRFKAVAFDYFVIFNANSVIPAAEEAFPGRGAEFTKAWRAKQFEYGFLRSITGRHADFFEVTEDALVYTAASLKLELTPEKRRSLLDGLLESSRATPTSSPSCTVLAAGRSSPRRSATAALAGRTSPPPGARRNDAWR